MSKQLKGTTDSVRDGPENTPLKKQRSHPTMCANPPGTGHEDAHEGANAPCKSGRFLPMVLVFQGVVPSRSRMGKDKEIKGEGKRLLCYQLKTTSLQA
jgi:hypothetical protein